MRTFEEFKNDEEFWDAIFYSTRGARRYDKVGTEETTCNYSICAECGGRYCKRCGCHLSPDDFKDLSFDEMLKEFKKGYLTIEVIDGDPFFHHGFPRIVRMRNVDSPVVEERLYARPQSPCVMLGENGCKLEYHNRPAGGRLLVPNKRNNKLHCKSRYNIEECMHEWLYHQKLLAKLADCLRFEEIPTPN